MLFKKNKVIKVFLIIIVLNLNLFYENFFYLNFRLSYFKIIVYSNFVFEIDMIYCWIYEENVYYKVEFFDFLGDEVCY